MIPLIEMMPGTVDESFLSGPCGCTDVLAIPSMGRLYIYLHEWLTFMVNVGKC